MVALPKTQALKIVAYRSQTITVEVYDSRSVSAHLIAPSRTATATGAIAAAIRELIEAERYGMHLTSVPRDLPARLEQLRIPYKTFAAPSRGTGSRTCWIRLGGDSCGVREVKE